MKIYTTVKLIAFCCSLLGQLSAHDSHSKSENTPTFRLTSKIVTGQSTFPCPPTGSPPPYPNTQVEPSLAIGKNPIDSRYPMVVIVYQEDRYPSAGSNANYMIISLDGGKTFGDPIPLPTVTCFGGRYLRDTDPNVAISSNGEIYFASHPVRLIGNNGFRSISVAKYDVCKKKFIYVKDLALSDIAIAPYVAVDFDKIILDTQDKCGKTGYVSWVYDFFPTRNPLKGQSIIQMSKTTDGVNWSAPIEIYQFPQSVVDQFGGDVSAQGPSIALLNNPGKPFSKLVASFLLFVNFNNPPPPFIQSTFPYTTVSLDQGETWSNPIPIDSTNNLVMGQPVDPSNFLRLIRGGASGLTVDRDRNIIYALSSQHSLAYDGIPTQVILYVSLDDAASWNKIGTVNTVLSTQAFFPTASVIDEGRIAISYYDFRNYSGDPNGSLETDRWMDIYYFDEKNLTLTLEKELRLTKESFNLRNAPSIPAGNLISPPGLFIGDYFGQDFFERKIYTVFSIVPPNQGPNQSHLQFSIIEQKHPIPGNQ